MTAQANGTLPPAAREGVLRSLVGIGFDAGAVLRDYAFSIGQGQTAKADLLAFADPMHRTPADYAAISAAHRITGQEPQEQVDTLSKSGALFHLLHEAGAFQLWVSDFDPSRRQPLARPLGSTIAPDRLTEALGEYGADLTPERIVGVKQGREWFAHESLRGVAAQQMTLWVMDVNRPLLLSHFEAAVKRLQKAQDESGAWDDNDTTRMSVQLLGAVVLADTDVLGTAVRLNRGISLNRLWAEGHRWFPDYFQPIVPAARQAAEAALEILRAISYSGFQPEMLVDLYKEAYRKEQRRRLGRFDTPMYLTRAIWEHIPVEMLPPDQRLVCDMTSGWGSFLVAGYERLARLGDMRAASLSEHLIGNDVDLSAALLARFGLLISTGHDSWKVHREDALRWRWLDENRPTVIVGNPPFSGSRKEARVEEGASPAPDGRRARQEKAVAFFERAIDRRRVVAVDERVAAGEEDGHVALAQGRRGAVRGEDGQVDALRRAQGGRVPLGHAAALDAHGGRLRPALAKGDAQPQRHHDGKAKGPEQRLGLAHERADAGEGELAQGTRVSHSNRRVRSLVEKGLPEKR